MSPELQIALQNAINGLLLGGTYALVAVGFSLVWGVLNVVNLAHGSLVMLGAYVTYWLYTRYRLDPFATLPLTGLALFGVGYPLQRLVINQVIRASFLITFLLTFGLDLLVTNLALAAWTADVRAVTTPYSGRSLALGPLALPLVRAIALLVALAGAALLQLLLTRTRLGSVPGAFLGGLLLGLLQTYAAAWLGPNYDNIVAFSVLVLVLVVRPAGLLGRVERFRG